VDFIEVVELIVRVIEALAIAILAVGVAYVLLRAVGQLARRRDPLEVYEAIRYGLGRILLIGLEVLIAADIIATVALDLTITNVAALGLIVLIRTFLGWAIEVETDGHWPWQATALRNGNNRTPASGTPANGPPTS
jgi:uncharacterized membrane protein